MSNKTKIDISNSKRPASSEINVFDEYEKEIRSIYDHWVNSWVDDWVMGGSQGNIVDFFRHNLGHKNFRIEDALRLKLMTSSDSEDSAETRPPPQFEEIFDAHWELFELRMRKIHADLLAALGNGEQSILIAAFYMGMQYHLKSILRVI